MPRIFTTIAALLERDRETNILVSQLQKMLTPLLGRSSDVRDDDPINADVRPQ